MRLRPNLSRSKHRFRKKKKPGRSGKNNKPKSRRSPKSIMKTTIPSVYWQWTGTAVSAELVQLQAGLINYPEDWGILRLSAPDCSSIRKLAEQLQQVWANRLSKLPEATRL